MNEPPLDNLESRLRDATTWNGPTTQVWKRALATQAKPSISPFGVIAFAKRRWFPLVSGATAACLAVVLLTSSQLKSARTVAANALRGIGQASLNYAADGDQFPFEAAARQHLASPPPTDRWSLVRANNSTPRQFNSPSQTGNPTSATDTSGRYDFLGGENLSYSYQYESSGESTKSSDLDPQFPLMADANPYVKGASPAAATRHVIHKATLELSTPDVRAAFLKAGLILNEGLGEHVQDSSLTGSGETASATLTLRVAASRLYEVANALRELGTVVSEHREGQDVTGQVIDVEARLHNEKRVEQELLALFDQRKDAPLKDVLDLRQKLSEVRSGIEQLVGQRDQLSRLVSLATVLVIIRTGEKPPEPLKEDGLWKYFRDATTHAWQSGLRGLADTVAALLAIFIGGLIWWILLAIALLLLRRYVRSRKA